MRATSACCCRARGMGRHTCHTNRRSSVSLIIQSASARRVALQRVRVVTRASRQQSQLISQLTASKFAHQYTFVAQGFAGVELVRPCAQAVWQPNA